MDVRGLHFALQFQFQAEIDVMLALVIAALNSRRRIECARGIPSILFLVVFSQLRAADRFCFAPFELECSGADCLIYFTPNLFLGTMTIFILIKCLIHTKKCRYCQFENYLQTDGVFSNDLA